VRSRRAVLNSLPGPTLRVATLRARSLRKPRVLLEERVALLTTISCGQRTVEGPVLTQHDEPGETADDQQCNCANA